MASNPFSATLKGSMGVGAKTFDMAEEGVLKLLDVRKGMVHRLTTLISTKPVTIQILNLGTLLALIFWPKMLKPEPLSDDVVGQSFLDATFSATLRLIPSSSSAFRSAI